MKLKLAWAQVGFPKDGVIHFFDGISGKVYRIDEYGLEIHHIDFDKANSDFNNLLLVKKGDSHITRFANTDEGRAQKREYIFIGKMNKLALNYGFAPKSWSHQDQAKYISILNIQARRFMQCFFHF